MQIDNRHRYLQERDRWRRWRFEDLRVIVGETQEFRFSYLVEGDNDVIPVEITVFRDNADVYGVFLRVHLEDESVAYSSWHIDSQGVLTVEEEVIP